MAENNKVYTQELRQNMERMTGIAADDLEVCTGA